jgi:AGZA family xanthine/uracil permease-like MFS transporter
MGLNAYFAFTMVPELGGNWQLALGIVFLSGALFLLISLTPLREWLINAIPLNFPALTIALMIPLSYSIATGIGLGFIAYVALKLLSGRVREINAASGTIAGAFLLKLIIA